MRWIRIDLDIPLLSAEPVSAALIEIGCGGTALADPAARSSDPFANGYSPNPLFSELPAGCCRVSGFLPMDDRIEAALEDLRARLALLREAGIEVGDGFALGRVDDDSWSEAWKAYFKPLRVGRRFVVKPSWEPLSPESGDLVIEIDPGMAFGTGTHPTTRLCLQVLEEQALEGARVLDWGTGSGILAVGAALLGAREVVAVDLDPVAVKAAEANARLNGLQNRIHVSPGSIEQAVDQAPFDLVVANIVANPIIAGAEEVRRRLGPGGRALVSGVIDQRESEVVAALQAAGLSLVRSLADQEWRALLFSVPGTG